MAAMPSPAVIRPGLLSLAVALVAAGCQSTPPAVKRSEKTVTLLVDTRQAMSDGDQVVADAQEALRVLSESKGDLRPVFDQFNAGLDALQRQADRHARDAGRIKAQNATYCHARRADIATISNDTLRQAAEQRTANMHDRCDKIDELYVRTNAAYADYLRDLRDLQTYLANELNVSALDSSRPWVAEAMANGDRLRRGIRDLNREIVVTSNLISPIPVPSTQWPGAAQPADVLAER